MKLTPFIDVFTNDFRKTMLNECDSFDEQDLTPALASKFFAALSNSISHAARMGIRQFIKSHDIDEPFLMREGVKLKQTKPVSKEYLTPFGTIKLERNNYQASWGGKTYQPLDEKWGMIGEFATEAVRECVMFYTAFMSPGEIVTCLGKSSLFHPSKTAIDNILKETGERTEANYEHLHGEMLAQKQSPEEVDILVCSMDGANILTREPGAKKGRPAERPRDEADKVTESSYRNAMIGVFSLYQAGDSQHDPKRIDANYIARSPEPRFTAFKTDFEREFSWHDSRLDNSIIRLLLHDGGRNIWNYCDGNSLYKNCLSLLDFYHASEHLSQAAEAIFGKKSAQGKSWYHKWGMKLKEGSTGVKGLINSIKYYQPQVTGKNRREALAKELTFFTRNAARMDYRTFLDKGLPIGSGPVEAGCKTIVKQRMCKSGQRWSLIGAQHVLHLRAIVKSKRWDVYWRKLEKIRLQQAA